MRLKKASVSEILNYVLVFTLFFGVMVSFMFTNSSLDKRSNVVDMLNKEAMILQAELEGYSVYDDFCNIYREGSKLENRSQIESIKRNAIKQAEDNIKAFFAMPRNASQLELISSNPVKVEITDQVGAKGVASVKIEVKYRAGFKSPYSNEDGGNGELASTQKTMLTDTATRVIENPIRNTNQ